MGKTKHGRCRGELGQQLVQSADQGLIRSFAAEIATGTAVWTYVVCSFLTPS